MHGAICQLSDMSMLNLYEPVVGFSTKSLPIVNSLLATCMSPIDTDSVTITLSHSKTVNDICSVLFKAPECWAVDEGDFWGQALYLDGLYKANNNTLPSSAIKYCCPGTLVKTKPMRCQHHPATLPFLTCSFKASHCKFTYGGTPCPDWSSMGTHGGMQGCAPTLSSYFAYCAWSMNHNHSTPFKVHENVPQMLKGLLLLLLGYYHDLHSIVLSPGGVSRFCVHRPRAYSVLVQRSLACLSEPWSAMLDTFSTDTHLCLSDLFFADLRGDAQWTLTAFDTRNLMAYLDIRPTANLYDLAHNPKKLARTETTSNELPCLTRNSRRIYYKPKHRCMFSAEKYLAMGIPVTHWSAEVCRLPRGVLI